MKWESPEFCQVSPFQGGDICNLEDKKETAIWGSAEKKTFQVERSASAQVQRQEQMTEIYKHYINRQNDYFKVFLNLSPFLHSFSYETSTDPF